MMLKNKIKIAVSSCLLGEAVRYDGTDKHIDYLTQKLAKEYTLISLCPEMAIGLGVPRSPIQLVNNGEDTLVLGVEDASRNVTTPLIQYGRKVTKSYPDICGYIFKKYSPSCGTKNVKVWDSDGEYTENGQGMYARTIMSSMPLLPVIDEEECLINEAREDFLFKVMIYSQMMYFQLLAVEKYEEAIKRVMTFINTEVLPQYKHSPHMIQVLNKLLTPGSKEQFIEECENLLKTNPQ